MMADAGSQPVKKRRKAEVVQLEDESDDEIVVIGEKRPATQLTSSMHDDMSPEDNAEAFYTQQQHPKFHTRNLERAIQKERAWSKPLPEACDLFFVAATPRKFGDLAVNPRQLSKLKALLSKEEDTGRILLVTGPAGCGKSTSIRIVAKSLKLDILEWERSANVEVLNYGGDSYLKEENELTSLVTFLRSSTLPTKSRGRSSDKRRKKLYHIDELPFLAYQDVGDFRRIIHPYLLGAKHYVVFDLTSRDSSWYMSPKRVFTKSFINSLNISELCFYPVASTFMRKGLRRTVDVMGFHSRLSAQHYRAVEKIANGMVFPKFIGDIRAAINIIQFSLLTSREKFCLPNIFDAASNDELFHMLGSLLYAKRQSELGCPDVELAVREDYRRPLPTREIGDILLMSRASADTVMMFLHEHEPNFSGSVTATRKVLDALSVSDALSGMWETRNIAQDYSSQICARATMFHNYQANRIARGFYAYKRPKWYLLAEKTMELKREMSELMCFSGSERHFPDIDVPYLSLVKSSMNGDQYRLVSYLTRPWRFSWNTDRELWDHQIASEPSYRMAQLRECALSNSILSASQDDSDSEKFVIEDSEEEDGSGDSFDEPVSFR